MEGAFENFSACSQRRSAWALVVAPLPPPLLASRPALAALALTCVCVCLCVFLFVCFFVCPSVWVGVVQRVDCMWAGRDVCGRARTGWREGGSACIRACGASNLKVHQKPYANTKQSTKNAKYKINTREEQIRSKTKKGGTRKLYIQARKQAQKHKHACTHAHTLDFPFFPPPHPSSLSLSLFFSPFFSLHVRSPPLPPSPSSPPSPASLSLPLLFQPEPLVPTYTSSSPWPKPP